MIAIPQTIRCEASPSHAEGIRIREILRDLGAARGDRDGIVRRVLWPSERAVGTADAHVAASRTREIVSRDLTKRFETLDREHFAGNPAQDGSRVAGAGADLEIALARPDPQRLR